MEREGKALVAVTDQWSNWQNLSGVQTSWSDGTVLYDYSGAHGNQTITVYGGGKVDLSIPPCDGSANLGRRGYAIWAPQGIVENYSNPSKQTTQEWEMSNDLGDRHNYSLMQGGALPDNSLECRVVGRVFSKAQSEITIDLYPETDENALKFYILDKDCNVLDSIEGTGVLNHTYTSDYSGWYTFRVSNSTATQPGQKCWVKVTYQGTVQVNTEEAKNRCECSIDDLGINEFTKENVEVYPIPFKAELNILFGEAINNNIQVSIYTLDGRLVYHQSENQVGTEMKLDMRTSMSGTYLLELESEGIKFYKNILKL